MSDIIPAATVMLIRPSSSDGIEVLLLKRNKKLKFAPSFWVFPGGRVDATDGTDTDSELLVAKKAAARELMEEANVTVATDDLHPFYHWTTPSGQSRRFGTWFFHTKVSTDEKVIIDDGEIVDYLWLTPQKALEIHIKGDLPMLPPTLMSLNRIKGIMHYDQVIAEYERTGLITVAPRMTTRDGEMNLLYPGDSGYDSSDPNLTDAQHRLIIRHKPKLAYQFLHENCDIAPINGGVDLSF